MRRNTPDLCAPPESPRKSLTSCRTIAATILRYYPSYRWLKGARLDETRRSERSHCALTDKTRNPLSSCLKIGAITARSSRCCLLQKTARWDETRWKKYPRCAHKTPHNLQACYGRGVVEREWRRRLQVHPEQQAGLAHKAAFEQALYIIALPQSIAVVSESQMRSPSHETDCLQREADSD
jgi:hypothetical protein